MPSRKPFSNRERMRRTWCHMHARCYNPKAANFDNYGGRGISVCERWHTFENFLADMPPRPDGLTLDRIDCNGNYEPSNCRWASRYEQVINRRCTHWLTFNGETLCLRDWGRKLGVPYQTIRTRLVKGWNVERALTVPVSSSNGSKFRKPKDSCKQGHLYTEHGYINTRGHRACRTCERIKVRLAAGRPMSIVHMPGKISKSEMRRLLADNAGDEK